MARPPAFIDHIIIRVADLSRSLEFYRAALKSLGAEVTELPGPPESSWGPAVVLGPEDAEDLALVEGEPASPLHIPSSPRTPRRRTPSTPPPSPAGA
jgi:catechol 2,3-dioxygenase-like lactoylglutathione lyase family enzyme